MNSINIKAFNSTYKSFGKNKTSID